MIKDDRKRPFITFTEIEALDREAMPDIGDAERPSRHGVDEQHSEDRPPVDKGRVARLLTQKEGGML